MELKWENIFDLVNILIVGKNLETVDFFKTRHFYLHLEIAYKCFGLCVQEYTYTMFWTLVVENIFLYAKVIFK